MAPETTKIRYYEVEGAPAVTRLFYETVHSGNRADYSRELAEAWAPEGP